MQYSSLSTVQLKIQTTSQGSLETDLRRHARRRYYDYDYVLQRGPKHS